MRKYYSGKTALVTGGTQGIGLSVARLLTQMGSRVILAARNEERLENVRSELGEGTSALSLDVGDHAAVASKVSQLIEQHGPIDLVFNCAGLALPAYLDLQPVEDVETMMRVNFLGTYHVCKAVVPSMVDRRSGVVVNTSSLGGLMGLFGYTGYCASKYAVVGFSEALRREIKPFGVKVCLLCPPNTDTPGLLKENEKKPPEVLAQEENVKTVAPEVVAQKLLHSVSRGKPLVIPTLGGHLAYLLSRYAPWALDLFLKRPI